VSGCVLINFMTQRPNQRERIALSPAAGLLLLSGLWAVASLSRDLFPHLGADALAPAQSQAVLLSVFAIVAASIAVAQRAEFPRGGRAWASAGIGVGLFVIPAALAACVQGWVSNLDRVAVFSLTPVFAVVLEPHLQGSAPPPGKSALAAALAAVAGTLLIFPLDISSSFRAGAALCALIAASLAIAATNCLAVRLIHNLPGRSALPMAAQAGAASALCFAAAAAFTPHPAWQWSTLSVQLLQLLLLDFPALFLLFWLMRRLAASRMTARFLLAPLFAIVAGLALEPASAPARAWLGIALLAGGAGWLVFAPPQESEEEKIASLKVHTADTPRRPQSGI
jgi:drug/metabolite transporter (DMT)-like permease